MWFSLPPVPAVVEGVALASPLASVVVVVLVALGVVSPPVELLIPVSLPTAGSLLVTMTTTCSEDCNQGF